MNAITQVVLVLVLWLITGIGFMAKYYEMRNKGQKFSDTVISWEGLFFFVSILVPIVILIHRTIDL
jgi:hypothetical protein